MTRFIDSKICSFPSQFLAVVKFERRVNTQVKIANARNEIMDSENENK